jgi:hypothetical protein
MGVKFREYELSMRAVHPVGCSAHFRKGMSI